MRNEPAGVVAYWLPVFGMLVGLGGGFGFTVAKVAAGASDKDLVKVYNSVKAAPGYPSRFEAGEKGTTRNKVNNKDLLEKLRKVERGNWVKVYKDGWAGEKKVSLHYFESPSGKVFDFKVKPGWSNL